MHFWDGNGWVNSLYFNFNDGQLHFDNRNADNVNSNFAAGVAFLPGLL